MRGARRCDFLARQESLTKRFCIRRVVSIKIRCLFFSICFGWEATLATYGKKDGDFVVYVLNVSGVFVCRAFMNLERRIARIRVLALF